jgi:hypothetical protein
VKLLCRTGVQYDEKYLFEFLDHDNCAPTERRM